MTDYHKEKFLQKIRERKDIIANDDGFYVYWPSSSGYLNEFQLRIIADELERLNEDWNKQLNEYFDSKIPGAGEFKA